jgi:hypothetical protein
MNSKKLRSHSFHPEINELSKMVAEGKNRGKVWERLHKDHKTKRDKQREVHRENLEKKKVNEMEECTWKPKITESKYNFSMGGEDDSFYKKSTLWQMERDLRIQLVQEKEKVSEESECTFAPEVKSSIQ